jgi:hypothetical protein
VPDVVTDRLDAEMKLGSDLLRRPAKLEELQDLRLAWSEVQFRMPVRLFDHAGDLAEHADDVIPLDERHGADLRGQGLAVGP